MTLDSGLFCIFNAPGSALPDAGTGLPGVRVSLPPGPVFRPEAVTITSFRDDGWLGGWNGAALVRVTRGPAQILVTIYQAPNSQAEAPKLQIIRLAESAALPPLNLPAGQPRPPAPLSALPAQPGLPMAPPPAPPPPAGAQAAPQQSPAGGGQVANLAEAGEVVAHLQGRGDVSARLGEWMGEPDSKRWIEGFAVAPRGQIGPADVEYQAVLGRGWLSPWAEGGQYCGSRGMSLPILGLRMRLRGEAAERFDCIVSATFVDGTKVGPLDNGEPCQADSMSPLEAFKIKMVSRPPPEVADQPASPPASASGKVPRSRSKAPIAVVPPAAVRAKPAPPAQGADPTITKGKPRTRK